MQAVRSFSACLLEPQSYSCTVTSSAATTPLTIFRSDGSVQNGEHSASFVPIFSRSPSSPFILASAVISLCYSGVVYDRSVNSCIAVLYSAHIGFMAFSIIYSRFYIHEPRRHGGGGSDRKLRSNHCAAGESPAGQSSGGSASPSGQSPAPRCRQSSRRAGCSWDVLLVQRTPV